MSMQYCAAPRLDAAWRMRFSCTKVCATSRPRPSSPSMVEPGTVTSVSETSAWSDGMLKVHHMYSILKPGVFTGTRKAEMPRGSPTLPEVRANTRSTVAVCMPVLNRFMPLITQSEPFLTAAVSMKVASEPCSGSVRPKPMRSVPRNMPSM